ncbi:ATP-binding cassette sub- A member 5 [Nowakowskiella sp. JEL0407]|nr:ATP-binding cassette sub- A member 5 [Nowakowskiella sp. JEL0407]
MSSYYQINPQNFWAGVSFNISGSSFGYSVKLPPGLQGSTIIQTDLLVSPPSACRNNGKDCPANTYNTSAVLGLMTALDQAILQTIISDSGFSDRLNVTVSPGLIDPLPLEEKTLKVGNPSAPFTIPIYIVVAFSLHIQNQGILVAVVTEKEKKLKEGLLLQGLKPEALWFGWILWYSTYVLLAVILMTIALRITVLPQSDTIGPTMFRKAKVAAAFGTLFPILSALLFIPFRYIAVPFELKVVLSCLLYPTGLTFSLVDEISDKPNGFPATLGKGMSFSGFFGPDGKGFYFIGLLITLVWQSLLTIYLDQVFPGEFGTPRPWHFPLTDLMNLTRGKKPKDMFPTLDPNHDDNDMLTGPNIEADPTTLKKVGEIRHLTKIFKTGATELVAVDKLSLNFYEGEIFALLGQNGAGKSTTINMLTGMYPPTSFKSANLYGYDLRTEMREIRQLMGVVPQQNILWDHLSAEDHIRLIVKLKMGVPKEKEDKLVEDALRKAGLTHNKTTPAKGLSGGQKRKLAFAMAIVSNPKILILDEPSSALDPEARRDMWKLLMENKDDRLCIITTHFMDEADFVANRKAVIGKGKLQCMGTSLFLKSHFNIGYQLDVAINLDSSSSEKEFVAKIDHIVGKRITGATNLTDVDVLKNTDSSSKSTTDAKWSLPTSEAGNFSALFMELDSLQTSGGSRISSFGVTMPTLEEVFLKQTELEKQEENPGVIESTHNVAPIPPKELKTASSFGTQFYAMLKVRMIALYRQPRFLFTSLFLPIFMFLISIGVSKLNGVNTSSSSTNVNFEFTNPPYKQPDLNISFPVSFTSSAANFDPRSFNDTLKSTPLESLIKDYGFQASQFGSAAVNVSSTDAGGKSTYAITYNLIYNTTYIHAPAVILNAVDNMILRGLYEKYSKTSVPIISASLQSWSDPTRGFQGSGITLLITSMIGVYLISLSVQVPLSNYASELIRERNLKIDEQLMIMGLSRAAYWLTSFIAHFVLSLFTLFALIILSFAFGFDAYSSGIAPLVFVLLIVLGSAAELFFFYILSLFFKKGEQLQSTVSMLSMIFMLVPLVIVFIMDIVGAGDTGFIIHTIFSIIDPLYTLAGGLYRMTIIGALAKLGVPVQPNTISKPLTLENYFYYKNGILIPILCAIFHMVVLATVLIGGFENLLKRKKSWEKAENIGSAIGGEKLDDTEVVEIEPEDEDVVAERNRVLSLSATHGEEPGVSEMKVMNVSKIFRIKNPDLTEEEKKKRSNSKKKFKYVNAVKDVTFGVRKGMMFSLLGPNGAGKSSLISMAIGTIPTSSGRLSVLTDEGEFPTYSTAAHKHTGYCPQHDALWPKLTVREHLQLFCGVKYGASQPEIVDEWVNTVINVTGLTKFTNVWSERLSGGNKRKLSFAVSIVGDPTLCFLDEPTTGVDPASRRLLWNLILSAKSRRATVLTTHAMEEADALSSQIAIMVNGGLKCIGTSQHLKSRFGLGFLLEILCDPNTANARENTGQLHKFVKDMSPNAESRDSFQHIHRFEVPVEDIAKLVPGGVSQVDGVIGLKGNALGKVFDILETAKGANSYGIKDYAFGQTTLEQVFLRIAKEQKDDEAVEN